MQFVIFSIMYLDFFLLICSSSDAEVVSEASRPETEFGI